MRITEYPEFSRWLPQQFKAELVEAVRARIAATTSRKFDLAILESDAIKFDLKLL